MTTHQRLIAARTEILLNSFSIKNPDIVNSVSNYFFNKRISSKDRNPHIPLPTILDTMIDLKNSIINNSDIIYPTPITPESFDGEKKSYVFADELLQWEHPQPKYSLGQYIASKDGKGKIHKVSKNAFGYVYCILNQRQDGTIIGNACIREEDIGNDNPMTYRRQLTG